jgi:hypothetical protein
MIQEVSTAGEDLRCILMSSAKLKLGMLLERKNLFF